MAVPILETIEASQRILSTREKKNKKKKGKKGKKKMKENERKYGAFPECSLLSRELGGPPGRLSFFPWRRANFSECSLFHRRKGEPPGWATREVTARDLRGTWIWRREISFYRTEMKREDERNERDERQDRETRDQEKMKLNCLVNCPPSGN